MALKDYSDDEAVRSRGQDLVSTVFFFVVLYLVPGYVFLRFWGPLGPLCTFVSLCVIMCHHVLFRCLLCMSFIRAKRVSNSHLGYTAIGLHPKKKSVRVFD